MVGPSKILTVSYGTFSCTLEGFDEPFSTMKAIAEYFRDLAADDRYFGAEPPTPDAEMLHRIAEREIKRRVEAKIQDNGVVLRPSIEAAPNTGRDGDSAPGRAGSAERHPDTRTAAANETGVQTGIEETVAAPAMQLAPDTPAPLHMPAETGRIAGISEKLQRIRAAVAQARAFETSDDDQGLPAPATPEARDADETGGAMAEDQATDADAERLAEDAERAEAERQAAEDAERAEAERQAAEDADRAEAERRAAEDAERAEAERRATEDAERAEAERQAAEDAERAEAERRAAEDAERAEAERRATEGAERAEAERQAAEDAEAEHQAADQRPRRRVVVVRSSLRPDASATAPTSGADFDAGAEQQAQTPASDEVETDVDESLEQRVARALGETGLPAEAEAELLRELVAVEREAEEMRGSDARRSDLLQQTETEAAIDRLISQTDSQLQQPDAQRRQSTISHLKAAVAATRADAAEGNRHDGSAEAQDLARYRDDLARSVRPQPDDGDGMLRRPQRPASTRTERPRAEQPPLVLVSEQRIDRPADPETVRPRRVSAGALAMEELFDEDEAEPATPITPGRAFTDFIAPHNLTTLNETIEAAAAYVTHVEGCSEFTRPQVMRHVVASGLPMTGNRENLLRAFGLLMRQGLIRRARRGQFELSAESDFASLARRFAQR